VARKKFIVSSYLLDSSKEGNCVEKTVEEVEGKFI
jgi:hypothetical protein